MFRSFGRATAFAALIVLLPAIGWGQVMPSITFINQSGEDCLVKVVGPSPGYIAVPNSTRQEVNVEGGNFYIVIRYGSPGNYRYKRGDSFQVEQTPFAVGRVSITLHPVLNGNYNTRDVSGAEF